MSGKKMKIRPPLFCRPSFCQILLDVLLLGPLAAPHAAEPWWHEYTPIATVGLRAESLETIQPGAARGVGTLGWYGFWFLDAQEQAGYFEAGTGKIRQAGVKRIVYYDLGEVVDYAAFFTAVCLSGTLAWIAWAVPIDAGMAIVLCIGMVITAQAFQATPREHAPAVVVGMLPGIGAWGALIAKNGLRPAGLGTPDAPFTGALVAEFQKSDTWIHGAFSLEQGFIPTAIRMVVISWRIGRSTRRRKRSPSWRKSMGSS